MEVWKEIKNYEGFYEVSNFGRVRSLFRVASTKAGIIKPTKGKVLSLTLKNNGYHSVILCVKDKRKRFHAHRLVAQHFIPNPENKPQVNHKDGNKTNNHVDNLEWNTRTENMQHAIRSGLSKTGEKASNAKLSENTVLAIKRLFKINPKSSQKHLCEKLNISSAHMSRIVNSKRWKHLELETNHELSQKYQLSKISGKEKLQKQSLKN